MKLTNTKNIISKKGMTLIELTVVILVLLSLMSVLFIGARAWMRGSDRASASLLIRNSQQGVRSHTNIMGLNPDSTEDTVYVDVYTAAYGIAPTVTLQNEIFGPQKYVETPALGELPKHPDTANSNGFEAGSAGFNGIPKIGEPYLTSTKNEEFFIPRGLQ